MTHPDALIAVLVAVVGLAGLLGLWLLARRARRNRPTWDSPELKPWPPYSDRTVTIAPGRTLVDGRPYVVETSTPADPTVVVPWAERAARAAAMRRHPSLYRPTRSGLEYLANAVDEALATVVIPRTLPPVPPVITNSDEARP